MQLLDIANLKAGEIMIFWIVLVIALLLISIVSFLYALAKVAHDSDLYAGYDDDLLKCEYSEELTKLKQQEDESI